MSTSRPGSELRQPKLISVPLPPQYDTAGYDSVEAFFRCFKTHCVVQNGKTIHVYALPAFVLVQSIPLPSYSPVDHDALDMHNGQLAIAFPNRRFDIWNMLTHQCEVVQDYTSGNMPESPEDAVKSVSISFVKPSPVHFGNQDAETKDIQLQGPMIVILEKPSGQKSNLWIWNIPPFGRFHPNPSNTDLRPSFFRRINTDSSIRYFVAADRKIVAACDDCTIRIWDIITGDCNWVLMGHSSLASSRPFVDNYSVYSNSLDGTIRIWDLDTGNCRRVLNPHLGPVMWVKYSAPYIVSGYWTLGTSSQPETEILVWSMASEELLYKLHYVPKPGWHSSLLHVTDRQIVLLFLVPAPEGHEIYCRIWDLFSGAPVGEFSRYGLSNVKMHGFAGTSTLLYLIGKATSSLRL